MTLDISLAIVLGLLSVAMAVLGGVIATKQVGVRIAFLIMGALSVFVVVFQAVRSATAQAEFQALLTGGEAFPFVEMTQSWSASAANSSVLKPFVQFVVRNNDRTTSLFSLSVDVIHHVTFADGAYRNEHLLSESIPEIPPESKSKILGPFPINVANDEFQFRMAARNGHFHERYYWSGGHGSYDLYKTGVQGRRVAQGNVELYGKP